MRLSRLRGALAVFACAALPLLSLPACSSTADDSASVAADAPHVAANERALTAMQKTRDLVGRIDSAWNGVYDRGDTAAWEAAWKGDVLTQLDALEAELTALLAIERQLGPDGIVLDATATRTLHPRIEPITIALGSMAVLGLIAWVQETRSKVTDQAANKEAARKTCHDRVYKTCMDIEVSDVLCEATATERCAQAEYVATYGAVMEGAKIIVTETAKEGLKQAATMALPVGITRVTGWNPARVKAAVEYGDGVKSAWDTGTMIGQTSGCKAPGATQGQSASVVRTGTGFVVQSLTDSCSLYVGSSASGTFEDLPAGDWDLSLYTPGESRAVVGGVAMTDGQEKAVTFKKRRLKGDFSSDCVGAYEHLCGKLPGMNCAAFLMDNATNRVRQYCGASSEKLVSDATDACFAKITCPAPAPGSATCVESQPMKFGYSGALDVDGRTAQLDLTFAGRAVSGKLVGGPVCTQSARLPKTDITFNGTLYGTWLSGGSISGDWTGGDFDCDGKAMVGYRTSGRVSLFQEGDKFYLSRNVGGGRWTFSGGSSYKPSCP